MNLFLVRLLMDRKQNKHAINDDDDITSYTYIYKYKYIIHTTMDSLDFAKPNLYISRLWAAWQRQDNEHVEGMLDTSTD